MSSVIAKMKQHNGPNPMVDTNDMNLFLSLQKNVREVERKKHRTKFQGH